MRERQFPLTLPHETAYDAADFLRAECNLAARRLIDSWMSWPNRTAAIWGAAGAGKTHLAQIWATSASAWPLSLPDFRALDLAEIAPPVRFVLDLGAEMIAADDERRLFHLLNIVRERDGALLLVARQAPSRWPAALPDLASRLRAAPAAEAGPPDDGLFAAVLAKEFADRQLVVDRRTIDYLTARSERTFAAAQALVVKLDLAALAGRRKINVKLAGDVLAEIESERGGG